MTIGLFPMVGDLLHAGHLTAIEYAKKHCTYLIVALNADPTINSKFKQKPIETLFERWKRLENNKYVDKIIPYCGEEDLMNLLTMTQYDVRFIGYDHTIWTGKEYEEKAGIRYIQIPRPHNESSTNLRKRIKGE